MRIDDLQKYDINPLEVKNYLEKVTDRESLVVITGEFSSGKTCFLNAFLGKENFLANSNGECTPVLIDVTKNESENMIIKYKNGDEKKERVNAENIEKYTKYTKDYDKEILSVSIPVNSKYLPENVHVIDSPGTNTIIKEHEEITKYILKKSDIVLYLLNKTIGQSDIDSIREILKYTDDIIFIVTHMDEISEAERAQGKLHKSKEDINKLTTEIGKELIGRLKLDHVEIFPIGSKAALVDATYIDPIRECVKEYISLNGLEVIKKRVKKQLNVLFEDKLIGLEKDNKFLNANLNLEKDQIDKKINSMMKKISSIEEKTTERIIRIEEFSNENKKELIDNIKDIFDREQKALTNRIVSKKDITSEEIEEEFEEAQRGIGKAIESKLEEKINTLINNTYSNLNMQVNDLIESVDIELDVNLNEPIIEELDDSDFVSSIKDIMRMKEQCINNLKSIEEEIACTEVEKNELKQSMKEVDDFVDAYLKEIRELGQYVPEYEENIIGGGKEAGAKMGRITGEIADIALMFYNPAGAGKSAGKLAVLADKAKDTIKGISIIQKSTQKAAKTTKTAAEVSKKMKKATETAAEVSKKVKKAAETAKETVYKANDTRRKIVGKANEMAEFVQEQPEVIGGIGKFLDMLSLGYWGEKIGETVGEAIKPTTVILKENEERKLEWEQRRGALQFELENYRRNKLQLQEQYDNADSVREKRKLSNMIKMKNEKYDEMLEELEKNRVKSAEENIVDQIENYYKNEVEKILLKSMKSSIESTSNVYDSAKEKIKKKSETDLLYKIEEIKEKVKVLKGDKESLLCEINNNKMILDELNNYGQWIDEWVNEYANI